jgi:hypothetical protein
MADRDNCEGWTDAENPCSRTARLTVKRLRVCHQHAQIAESDSKKAKLWRQRKEAAQAA